ncbi:unnamed protein product (macronuclear) [Paramecium tetraurelia]|uniref:Uncharacterized protein n=1 Tax=Paramecium tetraurelia TaxID=5888 RepID=A0D0I2_PARTE|nr:uncharacterized protein GSPATT00012101001 [Paramecium tetraurelia]CAK76549.1 unnamed protein product [Paramecium tetraurelia]|eukprot:XP_001443946.1 hypothetical protein (macronuclear) [Paramecium tetraurelia strain d4-2]
MEVKQNRKYFKVGSRKAQLEGNHEIVTRTVSQEEDMTDLGTQLQKKMCLNEDESHFIEEILYTDPCEPEMNFDEKILIHQEVTFNPQQYLNNEHSIIG